jgi:hypothetical protein
MKLKTPQKTMHVFGTELVVPQDSIAVTLQNHLDQYPVEGCMHTKPSGQLICEADDFFEPECIIGSIENGIIKQRTVNFFGIPLVVPINTKYLSADIDGMVTAHSDGPWWEPEYYEGWEIGYMAHVDLEGMRWEDTLVNIEQSQAVGDLVAD